VKWSKTGDHFFVGGDVVVTLSGMWPGIIDCSMIVAARTRLRARFIDRVVIAGARQGLRFLFTFIRARRFWQPIHSASPSMRRRSVRQQYHDNAGYAAQGQGGVFVY